MEHRYTARQAKLAAVMAAAFASVAALTALVPTRVVAQPTEGPVKYWILLADKQDAAAAAAGKTVEPVEVSDRATQRRVRRAAIESSWYDLPVSETYIRSLEGLGVTARAKSRWLNAVSAVLEPEQVSLVSSLPFVRGVRPVAVIDPASVEVTPVPLVYRSPSAAELGYENTRLDYGDSATQLGLVNAITPLEAGINGTGVIIGFLDTTFGGFTHPVFSTLVSENRLLGQQNFALPQTNQHGMNVASVAVGFSEGNLIGPAHGASVLAATTEYVSSETNQEEDNFVAGLEWLESQGADVVNSSLGYSTFDAGQQSYTTADLDGDTGITTVASDIAVGLGVVVVTSAGNEGCGSPTSCWYYITMPADGDSVIAVGGVDAGGAHVSFSGRGPTADGRTKPDVSALATSVRIASGSGYASSGGTSFASPMIAGVAAQILQANPDLTPVEVGNILRTTSGQNAGPTNALGWGVVHAAAAVNLAISVGRDDSAEVVPGFTLEAPFPNPATDMITARVFATQPGDVVSVTVYDILGRRAGASLGVTLGSGTTEVPISLEGFATGVYLLSVVGENDRASTPFTVIR